MQQCFLFPVMHPIIPNMAEEPSEASVSSISIEDDVEPSVTLEKDKTILGYLGIFRKFLGYLEIFGGIFREKTGYFRID